MSVCIINLQSLENYTLTRDVPLEYDDGGGSDDDYDGYDDRWRRWKWKIYNVNEAKKKTNNKINTKNQNGEEKNQQLGADFTQLSWYQSYISYMIGEDRPRKKNV